MQLKTISTEIAFASFLVWGAFFLILLFGVPKSDTLLPVLAHRNSFLPEKNAGPSVPARLIIPSINVNTIIEQVGVTATGAMDVPKDIKNVGWYSLGTVPGEKGSAVIAGHYAWKDKKASAFDTLYKLRVGERVYVEDTNGNTVTFVVREIRKYDPNKDTPYVFNSSTEKSHLNLITCGGTWNQMTRSYSNRLVVFTDKEL